MNNETPTATEGDAPAAGRQLTLAMLVVLLANSAAALAYAALTVALADIAAALGVGEIEEVWLPDSFLVAVVCVTPLTAWLVRRLGGRRLLFVALCGLVVSAIASAAAPGVAVLVALLFAQGLFAAPIPPLTQALVVAILPARRRNVGMAIWSGGTMLGILAGSVLGGLVTEHVGWRSIFFLVVPLGVAALLAVKAAFAGEPVVDSSRMVSLDPSTLADGNLALASLIWLVVAASSTGVFETVMLGSELGFSPEQLGVINAARGVALLLGVGLGAVAVARLHPLGASVAALLVLAAGKYGYTLWGSGTTLLGATWPGVVSSIGYGMLTTSLAVLAFISVGAARQAAAASVFVFAGVVGSAGGVALLDAFRAWRGSGAGRAMSSYTEVFWLELLATLLLIPLALFKSKVWTEEGKERVENS